MKYLLLFLSSLILISCSSTRNMSNIPKEAIKISLIQLIANPEKYHKKRIIITGYFYYEKHGNALYVTKSDFENLMFKNSVFLYVTSDLLKQQHIEEPYKGFMSIEGIFDKNNLGWSNLYSGTIVNVIEIRRLFKRDSETDEYNIQ